MVCKIIAPYSFGSNSLMQGWRNFLRAHTQIVYNEILLRAQIDVPLSLSHSCVWPHSWALKHLTFNTEYTSANDLEVRQRALTDLAKE